MRRLALALSLLLAACAAGDVIVVPDGLPRCDAVPRLTADESSYGDRPVYVSNEMPIEAVQMWASTQPGFETLWIDRDHNGWITVAFSQDAEQRRADVAELFADDGVVVVEVDWTMEELLELQASIVGRFDEGFIQSTGVYEDRGVVGVGIGPLTEERLAIVEEQLAGEPVCIEGYDPALVPEPGPQPEAGDGWRLLADEKTGFAYRTGFASDRADLEALWQMAGISSPVPEVDFDSEVVIWFGAVYGSSCPNLRMDDVVVGGDVVYPVIVDLDGPGPCTDDANPHAYVVAMERAVLPPDGFVIRLQADDPFPGVADQQTFVHGDVTVPGSYVAGVPGEILGEEPGPPVAQPGGVVEPGIVWSYGLYTHCGIEWLGELNGVQWRAEAIPDEIDYVPTEWRTLVDDAEYVTVEIVLEPGDPPTLEATAAGVTVRYLPADEDPPGCD
ncbi:MAG TPA: hypothetical protein VLB67_08835 [Acidimicrobiia bacterium]|nr:hypothetical protein [Acidimicrobiia bacterium]